MKPERARRYLDKAEHARARLGLVREWLPQAEKSIQARLATYKAFQEAVEAAADLVAMALVDSGTTPRDDRLNFSIATEKGVFHASLAPGLSEAVGLRNRLVHEYERLEERLALSSIERLAPGLIAFLSEVESWATRSTK